jgi:hypothetical protein
VSHLGNPAPPAPPETTSDPARVYSAELEALQRQQDSAQRREQLLGYTKLALAAAALILAIFLLRRGLAIFLLAIPILFFLALAVLQEKVLASIRYRQRAISFYERGLARLHDRWAGVGETGERFLDPEHPYARDLDLFGDASLFQYLCTARTRAGEETLAQWLLKPAPLDEVAARQQAVRDLRDRVKFRELIASVGETVRLGVHPEALSAWGEAGPLFSSRATRVAVSLLAVLWLLSLAAWPVFHLPEFALLMTLINFGFAHRIHSRLESAAGSVEKAAADLRLLAEVLALIEREPVSSPRLIAIKAGLQRDGTNASIAIRRLARVVELIESRHSLFARPLDLVTFWSLQLVFLAERWQVRYGPTIRAWLQAAGEFEAFSALAGFAWEHPAYTFAEFATDGAQFDAEDLAHPLLPADKAVANDVRLGSSLRVIILSGPNMAGKSTFIRSLGINAVLAQCGAPVRAQHLRMSPLQVAASICVLDSLAGGMSRFYAEIHRIKLISDLAGRELPVLFLLDELLSGTNSHDRLIGTRFVVHNLVEHGALGIVSTHDLALTTIPDSLGGLAANCHFEDRLENGKLTFDYKLKPGVVQTSNALKLMQSIGLGVSP